MHFGSYHTVFAFTALIETPFAEFEIILVSPAATVVK